MKNLSKTSSSTVTITDADSVFNEIVNISTRTAKGVLEIGKLILQFEDSLVIKAPGSNQLEDKLVNERVMAASTISSYRTIGGCAELAQYIDVLPPFFNHLYVLATQEKKQPGFIRMKVKSGELDRTTTLSTIREWSAPAPKATGEKMERNGRLMLRLYVEEDSALSVAGELEKLVDAGLKMDVDYAEVDELNERVEQGILKSARRSIYQSVKDFRTSKIAALKKRYVGSVAKEKFQSQCGEVKDFLEQNSMQSVVNGQVDLDQLDQILSYIGVDKSVNDFYFEALAAA